MMGADQALKVVLDAAAPLPVVARPLSGCLHYVLAEPVRADRDVPPAHRSAMDGYAVRSADVQHPPAVLRVTGERAAGSNAPATVRPGTCVRIYTGAVIPAGADAVVRLEDTQSAGATVGGPETVTVLQPVDAGADILRKGENARRGAVLIPAGVRLGAAGLGLCAAAGYATLKVHRHPRVRVLTTGEELRDPGEPIGPHQVRDSNGPMLAAALRTAGLDDVRRGRAPDAPGVITRRLRAALKAADAVIAIGGVSVGRYDLVPRCVADAGATVRFHQVAMKPGKPLLFATAPGGRLVWGLPGNPVSAMVAFQEFVRPALLRMCGLSREASCPGVQLPLREAVRGGGSRRLYVLARVTNDGGAAGVVPVRGTGSADLVALSRADGCFAVAEGLAGLDAGTQVLFHDWRAAP